MDQLAGFHTAQGILDNALATLPDDPWQLETACDGWTVADILGHATWGQDWLGSLIDGKPYEDRTGAPGADLPAAYLHGPPLETWRNARDRTASLLTEDVLDRPLPEGSRPGPDSPVRFIVSILEFDSLAHAWDITHPHGIVLDVPDALVARVTETAHHVVARRPGFFAEEVPPPAGTDSLAVLMAFCGRQTRA